MKLVQAEFLTVYSSCRLLETAHLHATQATALMYSMEVLTAHDAVAKRRTDVAVLLAATSSRCVSTVKARHTVVLMTVGARLARRMHTPSFCAAVQLTEV
jgi:hypothetical protein